MKALPAKMKMQASPGPGAGGDWGGGGGRCGDVGRKEASCVVSPRSFVTWEKSPPHSDHGTKRIASELLPHTHLVLLCLGGVFSTLRCKGKALGSCPPVPNALPTLTLCLPAEFFSRSLLPASCPPATPRPGPSSRACARAASLFQCPSLAPQGPEASAPSPDLASISSSTLPDACSFP